MGFRKNHRASKFNRFSIMTNHNIGDVDIPDVLKSNKAVIDTNVLPKNKTDHEPYKLLSGGRSFHNSANSPFTHSRKLLMVKVLSA